MTDRFRRFFLLWGMLIAVFVLRGILPFLILWIANPDLSFMQLLTLAFSGDTRAIEDSLAHSKHYLLLGGGMYLFLVFLSWIFMEEKKYVFPVEPFIHRHSVWFYAVTSVLFTVVVYVSLSFDPFLAFAASVGTTAFFITDASRKTPRPRRRSSSTLR